MSGNVPADEMAEYLQMYLDETGEQLEGLVQKLLALEETPTDAVHLNEAFRLVHTLKGSAALMGFDSITEVTHQLENHLERIRSGLQTLDRALIDLSLRCVDFLRDSNRRLREGQPLSRAPELLKALSGLHVAAAAPLEKKEPPEQRVPAVTPRARRSWRILIRFEADLPLPDLKAQLAIARLA
jgi:two-component system chemotaxis sensor kinase CheA